MLKDTTAEMKNTVDTINSRLEDSEEWIRDLEDRVWKLPKQHKVEKNRKQHRKNNFKNEARLRDIFDIISTILIIWI